ncbi:putative leucine-rich repeat-containing protein DDB_G0290503 [Diabrotica virgifera virgifera]|uniref:Uncharacterized protein n=1 Tax=Diabrotica virgifera virgifera TaxID=50390 RepID=A0ABM5IDQ1_DIAVI|nr:putative leucine-rich repeat-containing protein DDB_G0290503 [Diabrotica virgifera virgifera]
MMSFEGKHIRYYNEQDKLDATYKPETKDSQTESPLHIDHDISYLTDNVYNEKEKLNYIEDRIPDYINVYYHTILKYNTEKLNEYAVGDLPLAEESTSEPNLETKYELEKEELDEEVEEKEKVEVCINRDIVDLEDQIKEEYEKLGQNDIALFKLKQEETDNLNTSDYQKTDSVKRRNSTIEVVYRDEETFRLRKQELEMNDILIDSQILNQKLRHDQKHIVEDLRNFQSKLCETLEKTKVFITESYEHEEIISKLRKQSNELAKEIEELRKELIEKRLTSSNAKRELENFEVALERVSNAFDNKRNEAYILMKKLENLQDVLSNLQTNRKVFVYNEADKILRKYC